MVRAAHLLAHNRPAGTEREILVPVSLLLTLVAAEVSFHFVERPVLRLKDRLAPGRPPLVPVLL
jgi:peptidoglycan/LPS O-acetylase OafA/YrhL